MQSILGEGSFGKVAKCTRMNDLQTVAIKVIKNSGSYFEAEEEVTADQSLTSTSLWQFWFQQLVNVG